MAHIPRLAVFILASTISLCYTEHKDLCDDYYCANGGECILIKLKNGHGWNGKHFQPTCQCAGSWTGDRCDDNPCQNVSCNTGTCFSDYNGTSHCCCPEGTSGDFCEITEEIQAAAEQTEDPCLDIDCNGGRCVVENGAWRCACGMFRAGEFCDQRQQTCPSPNRCVRVDDDCENGIMDRHMNHCFNGGQCCIADS